ncbi:MAG TPA: sialidase family protein [Candidatus Brocadiia bacterium]|nr:sialidase family protein [Candidatus Brocadiia bacterium]
MRIPSKTISPSHLEMALLFVAVSALAAGAGDAAGPRVESTPFTGGKDGYACYRAPALIVSQQGTLLAFCEGRVNDFQDEGDIDVVLKRSTDGGRSWGPIMVLENDGENRCKNACPVVLPNGRILVVWLWNKAIPSKGDRTTRDVYLTTSDDEGVTWSKSRNITSAVYREDWGWYGAGPCHGIVKQREPHKGRVIIPCRHNSKTTHTISHIIYSDDNGETWRIGGSAPMEKTNESTIAELSNGDLMLNSRNGNKGANDCRIVSISSDGGESFSVCYVDHTLVEPGNGCFGSILFHSMNSRTGKGNIIFSNPNHGVERMNGTLKLSEDDGKTWTKSYRYSQPPPAFSGYSDIAVINGSDVAVLYEKGDAYRKENRLYKKGERYEDIGFQVVRFKDIAEPIGPAPSQPATSGEHTAGHGWRMDRFMISLWGGPRNEAEAKVYADANFNTVMSKADMLDSCLKNDLRVLLMESSEKAPALAGHKAVWGWFVQDEPKEEEFPRLARDVQRCHDADPGHPAYVNMLPIINLDAYISTVKPRVLSYDYYQWWAGSGSGSGFYCRRLEVYREAALKAGIPLICWVEGNADGIVPWWEVVVPTPQLKEEKSKYLPDNAQKLRQSVFVALAYGVKGIQWFVDELMFERKPDGQIILTRSGEDVKAINADLRVLGPTLVQLSSVGVFHTEPLPQLSVPVPERLGRVKDFLEPRRVARSVPVQIPPGMMLEGECLTLGLFDDERGCRYAMIVNRDIKQVHQATLSLGPDAGIESVAFLDTARKEWATPQLKDSPGGVRAFVVDLRPGDGVLLDLSAKPK